MEKYNKFKRTIPREVFTVDYPLLVDWICYRNGPVGNTALVFLPPAEGNAEFYLHQILKLPEEGLYCIACDFGSYVDHEDWAKGFDRFLDMILIENVHIFGAGIGGFLAQYYAENYPKRVLSLICCNSYSDTTYYKKSALSISLLPLVPTFSLKGSLTKQIKETMKEKAKESDMTEALSFVLEQLDKTEPNKLASNIILRSIPYPIGQLMISSRKVMVIYSTDSYVDPVCQEDSIRRYPNARVAWIKKGGEFPYLSGPDDINVFILIHLNSLSNNE